MSESGYQRSAAACAEKMDQLLQDYKTSISKPISGALPLPVLHEQLSFAAAAAAAPHPRPRVHTIDGPSGGDGSSRRLHLRERERDGRVTSFLQDYIAAARAREEQLGNSRSASDRYHASGLVDQLLVVSFTWQCCRRESGYNAGVAGWKGRWPSSPAAGSGRRSSGCSTNTATLTTLWGRPWLRAAKSIASLDAAEFERVMCVNALGTALGMKHAVRAMLPRGAGSIVSLASVAGVMGGMGPHAYTASKHALVGLTKNVACELGERGICVNCISPFGVATPMLVNAWRQQGEGRDAGDVAAPSVKEVEKMEEVVRGLATLKGATLKPRDIAEAALYLASDESRYVSGHNLVVMEASPPPGTSSIFREQRCDRRPRDACLLLMILSSLVGPNEMK